MIPFSELFGIVAAICLIPPLYRGAAQDLKEFKFSEIHFDSLWINAAIFLDVLMYVALIAEGSWVLAAEWLVLSIAASLIFSFIAFRYGGGGDWRALIFIAWIAPFMLIDVILASAVCGIVQAVYWLMRTDIDTPPMYRKIPFALSIFAGYLISLLWLIVTAL
jgi:prepilin signal peptidase PulO-like enzyme (type II secretory pathway)